MAGKNQPFQYYTYFLVNTFTKEIKVINETKNHVFYFHKAVENWTAL